MQHTAAVVRDCGFWVWVVSGLHFMISSETALSIPQLRAQRRTVISWSTPSQKTDLASDVYQTAGTVELHTSWTERVQVQSDLWAILDGCPASCMLRPFFPNKEIVQTTIIYSPLMCQTDSGYLQLNIQDGILQIAFFLMLLPSSFILQNCTSIIIHTTKLHSHKVIKIWSIYVK